MSAAKVNQSRPLGLSGNESIRQALEQAAEVLPQPIWPDPPDLAAYHGIAGDFVRTVESYTEADPVALLAQFLVAFGAAAGRNLHRVVEKTRHHFNIFAVLVGDTSKARKGSSWSWVEDLFRRIDPGFTDSRVLGGMSSGEGLIWAVRDPIEKPNRRGRGENAHVELEVTDLGVDDKRLLVLESEFSSALRVAARCENILTEIIRRAWDGNHVLQTLTKNSPAKATDAHIAIVGHITADELRQRLDRSDVANGFANRFMFLCVKRSKAIAHPIERSHELEAALASVAGRLRDALHFARSDRQIEFSPEASDAWTKVYPELSEGAPGLLGAILSRAEAQVLRLAMAYAALDGTSTIGRKHLEASLALWDYVDRSTVFIFGDSLGNPDADAILEALRKNRGGLSRTDIRDLFKRNLGSHRIERALLLLATTGKARREAVESEGGGRPTEIWFAKT